MKTDTTIEELPGASNDLDSPDNDLNRQIVALLEEDGRMPFSEIAQKLDVSEGTIRNRVARLKESGMLKIVAITDPVTVEYQADAMIGIRVASDVTPNQVAERLGAQGAVVYVLWVTGRYDLMVEVVCDSRDEFLTLLEAHVYGSEDIAEAEVMLGLKNFKNQFLLKKNWDRAKEA